MFLQSFVGEWLKKKMKKDEDKDKHEEAELEEKNEKKEKLISFAVTKIKDFL